MRKSNPKPSGASSTAMRRLAEAEKNKERWSVLSPEDGFPYPMIGFRLMKLSEESLLGWVQVQTGAKDVLERLASYMNANEKFQTPPNPTLKDSSK